MLCSLFDLEDDAHLWIKAVNIQRREIGIRVKDQSVSSCQQWLFKQEEGLNSTIFISPGVAELAPTLVCVLHFEIDGNAAGWCAARGVEDVC